MKQLIQEMADLCRRGETFALATVVTRNGSAPRSAGAKMLVRADGSTTGTVGGGMLEAEVTKQAGQVLRSRRAVVESFKFSGEDAASMDAICGGQVQVLVEWLDGGDEQLAGIIGELSQAARQHRKTWLVSGLPHEGRKPRHALVRRDGSLLGVLPPGLAAEEIVEMRQPALVETGEGPFLVEPLEIGGTAYIFGAGHVSRSLAEFTKAVGFWTVVLDDRAEYASTRRFPAADELVVIDSFDDALRCINVDRDSFIVIVTRGHLHDQTVLAQALKTGAGYIGMIGSRRKCALIFQALLKEGFTQEDIQRVHAPIGLPIEAETPEEIGISIVAEMIQVRAGLNSPLEIQGPTTLP